MPQGEVMTLFSNHRSKCTYDENWDMVFLAFIGANKPIIKKSISEYQFFLD
jgi:hypothetical protein